eukprot:TRINITY_DN90983_c0_g1_i1.p1 TRINITY_DN90983_c0_g1~~TRINITY_DN90983_c0_g1_i1.p1  ORF type:complete len:430 (+),score=49.27 TRINITY_DN90983_c0_g1_i1:120-1292(+)
MATEQVPTEESMERRVVPDQRADRDDPASLEEGVLPVPPVPGATTEADTQSVAGSPAGPAEEQLLSPLRRVWWMICMYNHPDRLEVQYPLRFTLLVIVVLVMAATWVGNFFISVHPLLQETEDGVDCRYALNQLKYNARVLFVYFVWFGVARASLFLPCILARVATVQSRTHGFCRTYCVHLVVRDGPIYIFVVGSVLFWFNILRSPSCEDRSPKLYQTLKIYAVFSCLLSCACVIVVYWHNKLIANTLDFSIWIPEAARRAPPDTIIKLETRAYDESVFGDEEGKLYPSECAICLGTWEADDVIKVTPCAHAFHEECIGNWLNSARTCALCRKDLVQLTAEAAASRPEAQAVGVTVENDNNTTSTVVVATTVQNGSANATAAPAATGSE